MPADAEPPDRARPTTRFSIPLLLVAATVLAFWPVLGARFVRWDDQYILTWNQTLNPPTWGSLRVWWTTPHDGLFTPVAYMVWGAIALVSRAPLDPRTGVALRPFPFHAANLCIHCLTVLVVYRLLWLLVGRRWPAAGGAAVFALHPLQVESVAHVSGIQGLLCALLGLTAVLQYLRFAAADAAGRPRPWSRYALATVAFALAVLSKPAGTMVPLIAGVLDVLIVGRPWRRAAAALAAPWVALAAPFMWYTKSLQPGFRFDVEVPLWVRPFIAADALAFYLYKLVWPIRLGAHYGRTPASIMRKDAIYYTWLAPFAVAVALGLYRRHKGLVAAALVSVAALLPVLGLTKFTSQALSTVADRYAYLPMFGVSLASAWVLARPALDPPPRRRWVAAACAGVLLLLAVRTHFQSRHWHDTRSLYQNSHWVNPAVVTDVDPF